MIETVPAVLRRGMEETGAAAAAAAAVAARVAHPTAAASLAIGATAAHAVALAAGAPRSSPPRQATSGAQAERNRHGPLTNWKTSQIVVERLTKNVNEEHLYEIFGQYGDIDDLDLPVNRQCGPNLSWLPAFSQLC